MKNLYTLYHLHRLNTVVNLGMLGKISSYQTYPIAVILKMAMHLEDPERTGRSCWKRLTISFNALGAGDEARESGTGYRRERVPGVSMPSVRAMRLARRLPVTTDHGHGRFNALGAGDEAREPVCLASSSSGASSFNALGAGDEARELP